MSVGRRIIRIRQGSTLWRKPVTRLLTRRSWHFSSILLHLTAHQTIVHEYSRWLQHNGNHHFTKPKMLEWKCFGWDVLLLVNFANIFEPHQSNGQTEEIGSVYDDYENHWRSAENSGDFEFNLKNWKYIFLHYSKPLSFHGCECSRFALLLWLLKYNLS